MAELSEVLGALMVSLVHARRMADEETAAVAEYYKDHPLLEGMSLPRVRVPELTIDMPVTIDQHTEASDAEIDTPTNILKAVSSQVNESTRREKIPTAQANALKTSFNREAKVALTKLNQLQKKNPGRVSREAVVRAVDDALQTSLKNSGMAKELNETTRNEITKDVRHTVSNVALRKSSTPLSLKTSAITSAVKEKATRESSVQLSITLREEGLEWATGQSENGGQRNRLQPE